MDTAATPNTPQTNVTLSTPPLSDKTVFIVEDDMFLIKAYQIKFEKEGITVWTASDGKEALTYLEKDPPAVLLLDLMLPGVSGFDVLEAIRKNEKWRSLPVLVLSNLSQTNDIERVKALGVEDYLVKANTRINDIVERVKKYL